MKDGMKKYTELNEYKEVNQILRELQKDEHVQEMKNYIQHGDVSTYEHCENVARLSYQINKTLSLHADQRTLLTGAMLHDFYLYDWHYDGDGSHHLHGFSHSKRACRNAQKYFDVDADISHVISSHMWPLTLTSIPLSREAWIVCLADKWISLHETLFRRQKAQR